MAKLMIRQLHSYTSSDSDGSSGNEDNSSEEGESLPEGEHTPPNTHPCKVDTQLTKRLTESLTSKN